MESNARKTHGSHSPNAEIGEDWPPLRRAIRDILSSRPLDWLINSIIGVNIIMVVTETDAESLSQPTPTWVKLANLIFLVIFAIELAMRLFVFRLQFFKTVWNLLDFSVVLIDVVGTVLDSVGDDLPSLSVLRIFRLARLVRGAKVIAKFPQLALLVQGCVSAVSTILWGMVLVMLIVSLWSILAVKIVHPLASEVAEAGGYEGCSRCPFAYETVGASMITILQSSVCGDSWGTTTIPVIEAYPVVGIFFMLIFMTVQVAILNVIMSVIVDSAMKCSQDNEKVILLEKEKTMMAQSRKLKELCQSMDMDGSGYLTKSELEKGISTHPQFKSFLETMDITEEDVETVFAIIDKDNSGTICYPEFITELQRIKSLDPHTMLVFIKYYVTQIVEQLTHMNMKAGHGNPNLSTRVSTTSSQQDSMEAGRHENQDGMGATCEKRSPRQDSKENIGVQTGTRSDKLQEDGLRQAATVKGAFDPSPVEKKQEARPNHMDDFQALSEQLVNLREVIQKDLVQCLGDMSGKFDKLDRVLEIGMTGSANMGVAQGNRGGRAAGPELAVRQADRGLGFCEVIGRKCPESDVERQ